MTLQLLLKAEFPRIPQSNGTVGRPAGAESEGRNVEKAAHFVGMSLQHSLHLPRADIEDADRPIRRAAPHSLVVAHHDRIDGSIVSGKHEAAQFRHVEHTESSQRESTPERSSRWTSTNAADGLFPSRKNDRAGSVEDVRCHSGHNSERLASSTNPHDVVCDAHCTRTERKSWILSFIPLRDFQRYSRLLSTPWSRRGRWREEHHGRHVMSRSTTLLRVISRASRHCRRRPWSRLAAAYDCALGTQRTFH